MSSVRCSAHALAAAAVILAALGGEARAEEPVALTWDAAFGTKDAPRGVHFRASYIDARGAKHALEVWRDGDRRVRRETDGRVVVVSKRGDDDSIELEVMDKLRDVAFRATRDEFAHLGIFPDFSGLGTVLARPQVAVRVTALGEERTAMGACRWFRVARAAGPSDEVCWAARWGVPLRLRRAPTPAGSKEAMTLFEVTLLEARSAPESLFELKPGARLDLHDD